jgi:hypothetical protein
VAKHKNRLAGGARWSEMKLDYVAKVFLFVSFDASSQIAGNEFNHCAGRVNCRSVFTWRLLANEVAQVGSHPFTFCFDAAKKGLEIHGWML